MIKRMPFFLLVLCTKICMAQPVVYTVANAHSHNDYEQKVPFFTAYNEQFGSIEADIFLKGDELLVSHDVKGLEEHRTLEQYYIQPLLACLNKNNGYPYPDSTIRLQMLIDLKTQGENTLQKLITIIDQYPALKSGSVKWVITGNRPKSLSGYPSFISFDGDLYEKYSDTDLQHISMLSGDLKKLTAWNGKNIIPEKDVVAVKNKIKEVHALRKTVRFWNAPDDINAWYKLMDLNVDFINTDHIAPLASFLKKLRDNSYTSTQFYQPYQPTYQSDGTDVKPKNIIFLIGDGTGLPQMYAGCTANKGQLNLFKILNIGFSKTSSEDNFVTDSAAGATAYSSGKKTNNRFLGVDNTGVAMPLLPLFLERKKMSSGLITSGDITGATPAGFYAHQTDRDSTAAILQDLFTSPVSVLMGSGVKEWNPALSQKLTQKGFSIVTTVNEASKTSSNKIIVLDSIANLSMLQGRGDWLQQAFTSSVQVLSRNKKGFFLMAEGAQIDNGGHANSLPYVVTEMLDFDQMIGKALEFADKNKETLVIITADHETGGLSLLSGDLKKGNISGQFSTNDHSAIPVPVFAYGPQSQLFRGVYENTEIFYKILKALGE